MPICRDRGAKEKAERCCRSAEFALEVEPKGRQRGSPSAAFNRANGNAFRDAQRKQENPRRRRRGSLAEISKFTLAAVYGAGQRSPTFRRPEEPACSAPGLRAPR